jgi:multiple antibiotic resistance protein
MEAYLNTAAAMLAVINPVICGAMILAMDKGQSSKAKILDGTKALLVVLVILLLAAVGGKTVLGFFVISIDTFQAVGGIILVGIGFNLLIGPKQKPITDDDSQSNQGLAPVIMFAASPGTISMVITLSVAQKSDGLPIAVMIGTTIAVVVSILIIMGMVAFSGAKKPGSGPSLFSRFMGLIVIAMGFQFLLEGLKDFF